MFKKNENFFACWMYDKLTKLFSFRTGKGKRTKERTVLENVCWRADKLYY